MCSLRADFPLRPALLGNLVPMSVNFCLGRSKTGSRTGLHHDNNDNLYGRMVSTLGTYERCAVQMYMLYCQRSGGEDTRNPHPLLPNSRS